MCVSCNQNISVYCCRYLYPVTRKDLHIYCSQYTHLTTGMYICIVISVFPVTRMDLLMYCIQYVYPITGMYWCIVHYVSPEIRMDICTSVSMCILSLECIYVQYCRQYAYPVTGRGTCTVLWSVCVSCNRTVLTACMYSIAVSMWILELETIYAQYCGQHMHLVTGMYLWTASSSTCVSC